MHHEAFLRKYERALATHSWDAIAPLIDDGACFIFSEGTYFGIAAIERAIRKTFSLIQNETYAISDVRWLHARDDCALCVYVFDWAGVIDGKACSGSGRGTSLLVSPNGEWKIQHEHLGPAPK